jgi:hypothetical protein
MAENRGIGSPGKDADAAVGPERVVQLPGASGRRAVLLERTPLC